ncbi:MAG: MFS transporter [Pseudomonadota bacterium]
MEQVIETARPRARWALAGLSLSMLMPSLDTSIANVGLPTLARAFGASFQQAQWIVLAYLLVLTSLIVGVGRLGDLLGRRRLLLAGIGLFTAASLLCGLAPTLELLIAARGAQGLGAAIMMALTLALVGETVPKDRTGAAMGLLGTMSAIGTTLGPSLGGLLISGFGWRMIFLINLPLGIANLVLAARTLPADPPPARGGRFDGVGTALLALTLGAYALAMTSGREGFGPLALLAATGAVLFGVWQGRAAQPLLPLAMFRQPGLAAGLAMSLLVATVMMATLVVGPFYLTGALRLDAARVGLVMTVGPLVAALSGAPAGRLADRFGAPVMTLAGLTGLAGGLLALAVAPARFGAGGYIGAIVVVTGSYALFQAANNTAIMAEVAPDQRGVISGLLSLSRNLGLITGACVLGAVFALATAAKDVTTASPQALAAGMGATFTVAAGLVGVAFGVALAGRRSAPRAQPLSPIAPRRARFGGRRSAPR